MFKFPLVLGVVLSILVISKNYHVFLTKSLPFHDAAIPLMLLYVLGLVGIGSFLTEISKPTDAKIPDDRIWRLGNVSKRVVEFSSISFLIIGFLGFSLRLYQLDFDLDMLYYDQGWSFISVYLVFHGWAVLQGVLLHKREFSFVYFLGAILFFISLGVFLDRKTNTIIALVPFFAIIVGRFGNQAYMFLKTCYPQNILNFIFSICLVGVTIFILDMTQVVLYEARQYSQLDKIQYSIETEINYLAIRCQSMFYLDFYGCQSIMKDTVEPVLADQFSHDPNLEGGAGGSALAVLFGASKFYSNSIVFLLALVQLAIYYLVLRFVQSSLIVGIFGSYFLQASLAPGYLILDALFLSSIIFIGLLIIECFWRWRSG